MSIKKLMENQNSIEKGLIIIAYHIKNKLMNQKLIIFAVISSLLLLLLSGCNFLKPKTRMPDENTHKYLDEYKGNWSYKRLPEHIQNGYSELYNKIIDTYDKDEVISVYNSETSLSTTYNGIKVTLSKPLHSRQEAKLLYDSLLTDFPEFFFLSNLYSYEGYQSQGKDYYDSFGIVYNSDAKNRKVKKAAIEKKIEQLLDKLNRSDPFETELALHDRLLDIVTYEDAKESPDELVKSHPNAFTVYGALIEGRAVCEGYARAMQLLLHRVGIECTLVSGTDQTGSPHMWNFVTLEGKNYHLDPTWNDSGNKNRHILFNLTTEEIERTHVIGSENLGIDSALSFEAQYFRKKGLYLDTFDSDAIAGVIAERIKEGANQIELQFGPTTYASAQLLIFEKLVLTEKVNAILAAGDYKELSMWHYENYIQDDNHFVLIIENVKTE